MVGTSVVQDENEGAEMMSPTKLMHTRKRKMEARDANHSQQSQQQDFAWETSKENVMPIKRGRNVRDLNRAIRTNESFLGKSKLDHETKEMEEKVNAYKGDDPLTAWVQYIRWIETNMPEDTRKKFAVLEKCTRELKGNAKYKNDIRYVRLWIQYADLVSNPKDIFKYLYQNKIGERVSLFYVGWAWVLESMANYPQAHKVYLKATQKKAQPEDLLDRKYKEFQRRMSRHWLKIGNSDGVDHPADGNHRQALEDVSLDGAEIQRYGNSESFRRYAQAQAEKMHRANAHKPVFTIYEDPEGAEVDIMDENSDWNKLDTLQHQNKENNSGPRKWNDGALVAQAEGMSRENASVPSPAEQLQVFVDDEFSACEAKRCVTNPTGENRSLTLRQRIEGATTEEEQLARKPLKNFASGTAEIGAVAKPPRAAKVGKMERPEKSAYESEQLTSKRGEELSFEEVRARKYALKGRKSEMKRTRPVNQFLADAPASNAYAEFLQAKSKTATDLGESNMDSDLPGLQIVRSAAIVAPTGNTSRQGNGADEIIALNHAAQEDMTINTRVAMEDVNNMFCSPTREPAVPVRPAKVWDIPEAEPVERKLHFSIFEDSMDSVAYQNDVSLRNDVPDPVEKSSFNIFSDDVPASSATAPTTASKASARKPLGSRDDLARRSKLTNKDMIKMHAASDDKNEATSLRSIPVTDDVVAPESAKRTDADQSAKKIKTNTLESKKRTPVRSMDPYSFEARVSMLESPRVHAFVRANSRLVYQHRAKIPSLWCSILQKRKLKKPIQCRLDDSTTVNVIGFLGSGSFAQVFSVKAKGIDPIDRSMAMKFEKTKANLTWEMYITSAIRDRVTAGGRNEAVAILPSFHRLDIFYNGSALLMEKSPVGTLHDLLNVHRKNGKPFPETLAVYYTIRMLYTVEILHDVQVLHGDIKPDNWLLVSSSTKDILPGLRSSSNNQRIFSAGGLQLIDFGRSIDLTHYPEGTTFIGDCHVKGFQTIEMLTNRQWRHQIDTFGICGTVHCMLFGEYMEVTKQKDATGSTHWGITRGLKRYWRVQLWQRMFDTLLNIKSCEEQPSLPALRRSLEAHISESPYRMQVRAINCSNGLGAPRTFESSRKDACQVQRLIQQPHEKGFEMRIAVKGARQDSILHTVPATEEPI